MGNSNKRSEYLRSLNKMRAGYQNAGNPLINAEDDNGKVGEEISSFAYMNTQPVAPTEQQNNDVSWKKVTDSVLLTSQGTHAFHGVANFLDDVWDFSVTATSWLAGGIGGLWTWAFGEEHDFTEGWNAVNNVAKPLITYDWQPYLESFVNQANLVGHLANGDMFSQQYWDDWGNVFTSAEKSREAVTRQEKSSFLGDTGVGKISEGVGYVLPSILMAIWTGGSSAGAQIATTISQTAIAGASTIGSSMEQSINEGASMNEAHLYSVSKGVVASSLAFAGQQLGSALTATGRNAVSNLATKAGNEVLKKTGSKAMEVVANKAVTIGIQAGVSGAKAYASTMAEPVFKRIYDENAFSAYEGENFQRLLEMAKENALIASTTTMAVGAGKEVGSRMVLGKDGYYGKFYSEKAYNYAVKDAKDIENLRNKFDKGIITKEQFEAESAVLLEKVENRTVKALKMAQEHIEKIYEKHQVVEPDKDFLSKQHKAMARKYHPDNKKTGSESKSKEFNTYYDKLKNLNNSDDGLINIERLEIFKGIKNSDVKKDLQKLFPVANYGAHERTIKTYNNILKSLPENYRSQIVKSYVRKDGSVTVNGEDVNIEVSNDGKTLLLTYKDDKPVEIKTDNDTLKIVPDSNNSLANAIEVAGNASSKIVPNIINVAQNLLGIPESTGIKQTLTLDKDIAKCIVNNKYSKQILSLINSDTTDNKDNFVIKNNNYIVAVSKKITEIGKEQFLLTKIDSKTNEIVDISIGDKKIFGNILTEDNSKSVLTFERVSKAFPDIPKSLEKTINNKIEKGEIVDYIGKMTGEADQTIAEKLGFNGIKKGNEVFGIKFSKFSKPELSDELFNKLNSSIIKE